MTEHFFFIFLYIKLLLEHMNKMKSPWYRILITKSIKIYTYIYEKVILKDCLNQK